MALVWTLICLAGVWGMVACTIGLILNAFPARDLFDRASSLKWGGALLLCFLFWMIGMANA